MDWGRSGSHFWGFERRGLRPDIVTMGKPVGNGYPMGVVVANRSLIEAFQATYGFFFDLGGNAVAAAAGLAVLEVLDHEQLMANAAATGGYLRRSARRMTPSPSVHGPCGCSPRAHRRSGAMRPSRNCRNNGTRAGWRRISS